MCKTSPQLREKISGAASQSDPAPVKRTAAVSRTENRHERKDLNTADGQYLMKELRGPLTEAMSAVARLRPADPLGLMAAVLYRRAAEREYCAVQGEGVQTDQVPLEPAGKTDRELLKMESQELTAAPAGEEMNAQPGDVDSAMLLRRDARGRSILHFAAERPHPGHALSRLLDQPALSLADRDEYYGTARDAAAAAGLLENVAAIDSWVAGLAARGDTERLGRLLLGGYDHILQAEDNHHQNIIHVAEQNASQETVRFLRSIYGFEEKRDWLFRAVRAGAVGHVRRHLDEPRLAEAKDQHGRTPLHAAVLWQHADIVRLIADKFPHTVHQGDNLERTPMHYAMGMSQVETIGKILLQAGASRTVNDLRGNSPSYFLMHPEQLEALIKEELMAAAVQNSPLPPPAEMRQADTQQPISNHAAQSPHGDAGNKEVMNKKGGKLPELAEEIGVTND